MAITDSSSNLTAKRLRKLLFYNEISGKFHWLVRVSCGKRGCTNIGDRAGSLNKIGYRVIGIQGEIYLEHRLAWLWMTGKWPTLIDHRDRCRDNNKFKNLREATQKKNCENHSLSKNSTTGITGVYRMANSDKWCAKIKHNWKSIHLGCFHTKEDALVARLEAERKYFTHSMACEPPS